MSDAAMEALRRYLGGVPADEYLAEVLTAATEMVVHHVGQALIPAAIMSRAITVAAAELYYQRNAPSGIANADFEGGALRIARDPMTPAYPLLAPYLPRFA